MPHFNKLTPAQLERLAILSEELGEAIQVIGKIIRHGYKSFNPYKPEIGDNRKQLTVELADVQQAINMLTSSKDIDRKLLGSILINLGTKRFLHHQK